MKPALEVEAHLNTMPQIVAAAYGTHGIAGKRKVEKYLLPELWCLHLYQYTATAYVNGYELKIKPGCLTLLPAGAELEYHYHGLSSHYFTHFRMNTAEPSGGIPLPAFYELGSESGRFESDLKVMVAASLTNPIRANVKLWELLWQLSDRVSANAARRHASLEKALALIEMRLAEELSVAALAREVGLSHNHLTRLFQAEFANTVVGYIRERRAERARHLLQNSTLPLRAVAAQIGIEDPRAFNALMKKETGRSPRAWREQ